MNPVSLAVLARVPLPNQANASTGADNSIDTGLHSLTADQFTARLDHQLNPKAGTLRTPPDFSRYADHAFRARQFCQQSPRAAGLW